MAELRPLYKKLLALAKSLPEGQREETLQRVRSEFREHRDTTDPKEVAKLIEKAQAQIGYIKIITPRRKTDSGVKSYVYKNGKRYEGQATADEGAKYKTQDIAGDYKRHERLVRRQHFMDRGVAPPKSPF